MLSRGFVILFLILLNATSVWCQNVPEFPVYNQQLIPPSPEVAALARFADHSVNYATGRPGVSISIYNIKCGSLVVPVSLDYSPGGLRVEEIASSTGLGWALSAGGMISRTVVGGADDHQGQGFLDNEQYAPVPLKAGYSSMPHNQQVNLFNQISSGALDVEPDNYSFNLSGKSGRFTINGDDKKVYTLPFEKIDIKYERNGSGAFARWIITTPDGTRYVFGERMALQEAYVESQENVRTDVRTQTTVTTTAWFLREMISANGVDTIFFNYTPYNTNYCNQLSSTKRLSPTNTYDCLPEEEKSYSRTSVTGYIISEIVGRFGKVVFGYEDSRQDLHGGKRLQYVSVFNKANLQTNKFELQHSYFLANQHAPISAPPCPLNFQGAQDRKLKLDAVKEISRSGEVLVKTFGYDYNEQTGRVLPHRFSNAQDDWGFYNGVNNLTLVPRYPAYGQYDINSYLLDGAIREPSESFTKIGSLVSITYPTGGHTVYEYEQNDTWAADFLHEVSLPDENVPYVDYARIESNTILDPAFPGFVLESAPFTVNSSLYKRQFSYFKIGFDHPNYQNAGCDFDERGEKPCRITVTLLDVNNNTIISVAPGSLIRLLANNTYKLRMLVAQKTQWAEDAVAYVRGPAEHARVYNKKVGGLRIRSITDFDGSSVNPSLKKEYRYLDESDNTKSSGKLNLFPSYHSTVLYNNQNPLSSCFTNTAVFQRTANSVVPLSVFSGSPVIYSRVESYQVGNNNDRLKSLFHFTDEMDDWSSASFFPFPPSLNLDHRRGLPILEEHFRQTATGYEIVSSKRTRYKPLCIPFGTSSPGCPNSKEHFGIKFSPYGYTIPGSDGNPNSGYDLYRIWSEWVAPEEITEHTYSSPAIYLEKKTLFNYDNPDHGQVTQVETIESDQTTTITDFKYSDDYGTVIPSPDPQGTVIRQLQDKKALLPVEKLVVKEDQNGGKKVVAGSIISYRPNSFLLDALYVLDVPGSIPFSSFTESTVNSSGVFIKDSRYRRMATFQAYDVFGNATDTKKDNDVPYAYIYDYNGLYPVCQVTGATSGQIAFTSFEAENKGRWAYTGGISDGIAATGVKYYNLTTASPASAFVTTGIQYVVSYWSDQSSPFTVTGGTAVSHNTKPGPGGWYAHEHIITASAASVSVSGNGKLDELRLFPKGSLMSTYTYIPLLGMTSQCDNNNRISYYDYDGLNRLSIVRDQERNIVKKICYNYSGQPEACGLGTGPVWQNTVTALRCQNIDGVNTGQQEQQQQDVNPASTSYGTTRWVTVGLNCVACGSPATWEATGITRCQLDGNGNFTGYREMKFVNTTTCSPDYPGEMWSVYTYDPSQCPLPAACSESSCSGNDKKCINGVCETGIWTCVSSTRISQTVWRVMYRYKFSDNSYSTYYQEIEQNGICLGELEPLEF
ncbi:MAG: hypothetical protein ABW007_10745 [Chitinophagaceae bacterium]